MGKRIDNYIEMKNIATVVVESRTKGHGKAKDAPKRSLCLLWPSTVSGWIRSDPKEHATLRAVLYPRTYRQSVSQTNNSRKNDTVRPFETKGEDDPAAGGRCYRTTCYGTSQSRI